MQLSKILRSVVANSNGQLVAGGVPQNEQPSAQTLKKLDDQIRVRVEKVDAVCNRSMNSASQTLY